MRAVLPPLVLVATGAWFAAARAENPPEPCGFDGEQTLTQAEATYWGDAAYDRASGALAAGGDLDGDGLPDLAVGSPGDDSAGSDAGSVTVIIEPLSGSGALHSAGFLLLGESSDDEVGHALIISDLDDDQVADLIIGAPGEGSGGDGAGATYVAFGPLVGDLSLVDAAKLVGESASQVSGLSVGATRDMDGDGQPELIIGAPGDKDRKHAGSVYLVREVSRGITDLSTADKVVYPPDESLRFGHAVLGTGDVDGDGAVDLAVAAVHPNSDSALDEAEVFLYGLEELLVSASEPAATLRLTGVSSEATLTLATLPDLDDDGDDELYVGLPPDSDEESGSVTVVELGGAIMREGGLYQVKVERDIEDLRDGGSRSVTLAGGDFDGEGLASLLIGKVFTASEDSRQDVGWIVRAPASSGLEPAKVADASFTGEAPPPQSGMTVAAADFDGDGYDDAVLGNPLWEGSGPESGQLWVLTSPGCGDADDGDGDGWSVCDGDCDDDDETVHPTATEVCDDGIDNDCNELVDRRDPACPSDTSEPDDTGETGDTGPEDTDPDEEIVESEPPLPLIDWARCEFRGGGMVLTLLWVPWAIRRRRFGDPLGR